MQILNDEEQEKCRTGMGLFQGLSEEFKPQHNETILSLQYYKLIKEKNENAKEWIGHLKIKINRCGYIKDKRLKVQFMEWHK